jgi:hypothetical protein
MADEVDKGSKSRLYKVAKNLLEDKKCKNCLHGISGIHASGSICIVSGQVVRAPAVQTCPKWKEIVPPLSVTMSIKISKSGTVQIGSSKWKIVNDGKPVSKKSSRRKKL